MESGDTATLLFALAWITSASAMASEEASSKEILCYGFNQVGRAISGECNVTLTFLNVHESRIALCDSSTTFSAFTFLSHPLHAADAGSLGSSRRHAHWPSTEGTGAVLSFMPCL